MFNPESKSMEDIGPEKAIKIDPISAPLESLSKMEEDDSNKTIELNHDNKESIDDEINSVGKIFNEYSAKERICMPSLDLMRLLGEYKISNEYSNIIRNSVDIDDYIVARENINKNPSKTGSESPSLEDVDQLLEQRYKKNANNNIISASELFNKHSAEDRRYINSLKSKNINTSPVETGSEIPSLEDVDYLLEQIYKKNANNNIISASEIFNKHSAEDRRYINSSDLMRLLDEYEIPSEYSDIIRNSVDIDDYIIKKKSVDSSWLNNILEQDNLTGIKEENIPKEIIDKLKSMMNFSLKNGAEKINGIGMLMVFIIYIFFLIIK